MNVNVTCVSCGNRKQVSKPRAGQSFPCELCGGIMPVPSYYGKKDPFARSDVPPSIFQRLARTFGSFAGLLTIAGGVVLFFSFAVQSASTTTLEKNNLTGGIVIAVAAALVLLGLIYFVAGLNIHDNGAPSAVVALVLGPLHAVVLSLNLLTGQGFPKSGAMQSLPFKYLPLYDAVTLTLLGVFLLCAVLFLITHDALPRVRASYFFAILCVYGCLTFAAFVAYQGFTVMGHPLTGIHVPRQLQDQLSLVASLWVGAAILLWLTSICTVRSRLWGALLGLLVAAPLAYGCCAYLYQHAPRALTHHDVNTYLPLSIVTFFALISLCPIGLLVHSLFHPDSPEPTPGPQRPLDPFAFGV